nr:hypothetical protein [Burkholderia ubonensis]
MKKLGPFGQPEKEKPRKSENLRGLFRHFWRRRRITALAKFTDQPRHNPGVGLDHFRQLDDGQRQAQITDQFALSRSITIACKRWPVRRLNCLRHKEHW